MDKAEAAAPIVGVSADSANGRLDLPRDDIITGTGSLEHKIAALYWDDMMNYNTRVQHRTKTVWRRGGPLLMHIDTNINETN